MVGLADSNCRSQVSERRTLNVTISHHWNSTSVCTTTTATTANTAVVEEDPAETPCALGLLNDKEDTDCVDFQATGWCVGFSFKLHLNGETDSSIFPFVRLSFCWLCLSGIHPIERDVSEKFKGIKIGEQWKRTVETATLQDGACS